MNYRFIESDAELETVCRGLSVGKAVAVDLEADSMYSFREKICLIQMAAGDRAYLIDPFEIKDFDPFVRLLENPDVMTVFHGSDFDIRSLDREYRARVNRLFDTEIACRFLGIRERGLAALLKQYFGVTVNKKFQKVDWSRRPLKQDMIEYSVGDVAHLIQLQEILSRQLEEKGRLHWAEEEFDIQAGVRYEDNHVPPLFIKFKGAGKLDNRSLAVLENLLQARLDMARKKDWPLFKIMSNDSLMTMAVEKPTRVEQMTEMHALSPKQAGMYGRICADAVAAALRMDHRDLPAYPRTRRPRKDQKTEDRITRLKKMRETLSADLEMEPGFLLNNALIGDLAVKHPKTMDDLMAVDAIRKWQVTAVGEAVLSVLN